MENDMISDVLTEIRRQVPELTREAAAKIDLEIRKDWGGHVVDKSIEWVKSLPSREIGSGMTKHVVRYPETGEDVRKLKSIEGSMRDRLDRVQDEVWETLYDSTEFMQVARLAIESIRGGESTLPPSWLGNDPRPDFTSHRWAKDCPRTASLLCMLIDRLGFRPYEDDEWFAASIARTAQMLKASLYVEVGSYPSHTARDESLATWAMKLARLQTEWELKKKWESRAMAQTRGGETLANRKSTKKESAIEHAKTIWGRPGNVARIAEVASLIKEVDRLTESEKTIIRWLKEAAKEDILNIPTAAQTPGRPKKEG